MTGRHGKKYREAVANLESREYSPEEAVKAAKGAAYAKFDETVELHINTTADQRHADQRLREVVDLPHGTGKQVRVLVFAEGGAVEAAKEAGADLIGDDAIVKKIEEGWAEFDVTLATISMMPKIAKLGRYLGRRGLMPSPKAGTVVQDDDIASAVKNSKQGRLEIKMDKQSAIHVPIGVSSFEESQLVENLSSAYGVVSNNKPEGIKGVFVKSVYLSTTMGPGIRLDIGALENSVKK